LQTKDKLLSKAQQLSEYCRTEMSLEPEILEDSLRDYSIKVFLSTDGCPIGNVVIYYSPKKDSFTPVYTELKDSLWNEKLDAFFSSPTSFAEPVQEAKQKKKIEKISIYVDGSFYNNKIGYAAVILEGAKVIHTLKGSLKDKEALKTRQVAGELQAVLDAVSWCETNSVSEANIYYDYTGIENWARNLWKANHPITIRYRSTIQASKIKIHWHKVKSHSGNPYNDMVDKLAREAIG
jgi:ribonuclease HI